MFYFIFTILLLLSFESFADPPTPVIDEAMLEAMQSVSVLMRVGTSLLFFLTGLICWQIFLLARKR